MKNSRFSYADEIDEFLPRLEKVQANFTLLAAGEIKPEEMTDESVKDLATLSLLIADLKVLKEDLKAEPEECPKCTKILNKNTELQRQVGKLQDRVIELLEEQPSNQDEPQKLKVCK